ncbi:hypothetical protein HJG60_001686 [Phyllostomus discolor]|uniref:Uncharacterized protein n=1 Tax=Phyllostomus discolor TaxID=89673 RepID=A0A834B5Q8_9CHIR|nr:hypothetical protein HJG60_001686 [Phyllostomus discolor]
MCQPRIAASFSLGCFFLLTALHIYANYQAVHALVLETLNEGRLWLVLKHFLQRGEVLDPTSANQMEPLWTGFWPSLSLSLGVPLHCLISSVFELQQLVEGHREPYLLHWDQSQSPKKESWVIVKETHQVLDKLFPKFLKGLQDVGWKTEKHQLEVDEWRATWFLSPEKKVL